MYFGRPTKVKNLVSAFIIVGALIFLTGTASGNLVATHIMVKRYWLPDLVIGRGPTQSINTLLKGSSMAGMGFNGAGFGFSNHLTSMTGFAILYYIPF